MFWQVLCRLWLTFKALALVGKKMGLSFHISSLSLLQFSQKLSWPSFRIWFWRNFCKILISRIYFRFWIVLIYFYIFFFSIPFRHLVGQKRKRNLVPEFRNLDHRNFFFINFFPCRDRHCLNSAEMSIFRCWSFRALEAVAHWVVFFKKGPSRRCDFTDVSLNPGRDMKW